MGNVTVDTTSSPLPTSIAIDPKEFALSVTESPAWVKCLDHGANLADLQTDDSRLVLRVAALLIYSFLHRRHET